MYAIAAGAGVYAITSYIFLKYPNIIHRIKKPKVVCQNICHRGGASENVENTIEAFQNSLNISGSQMLELDCHLTKDNRVVVIHDNNLKRLTGIDKTISDSTYKELPLLLPQHNVNLKHVYKIPLLEEVFQKFDGVPINVDIKVYNPELIAKVENLISKYGREDITLWGSFQNKIVSECYKLNPNIPIYFSLQRVTVLVLLYYTGLLPFVPLKESYLEIPLPKAILKQLKGDEAQHLPLSKKYLMILADKLLLRRSFIKHLEKRGILTYLWTLNDESDFEIAFKKLGVAGVMTDCPTKLKAYLDKHSELLTNKPPPNMANLKYD